MPAIDIITKIDAPIERCFKLSLSIDVHTLSTAYTGEKAIGSLTSGVMQMGDVVTWRAKHFGIWQELTSKIIAYRYPTYFCDEMMKGAFKNFRHEHHFSIEAGRTIMRDTFAFESPFGILGRTANALFLTSYMQQFLTKRNQTIKDIAESNRWKDIPGIY